MLVSGHSPIRQSDLSRSIDASTRLNGKMTVGRVMKFTPIVESGRDTARDILSGKPQVELHLAKEKKGKHAKKRSEPTEDKKLHIHVPIANTVPKAETIAKPEVDGAVVKRQLEFGGASPEPVQDHGEPEETLMSEHFTIDDGSEGVNTFHDEAKLVQPQQDLLDDDANDTMCLPQHHHEDEEDETLRIDYEKQKYLLKREMEDEAPPGIKFDLRSEIMNRTEQTSSASRSYHGSLALASSMMQMERAADASQAPVMEKVFIGQSSAKPIGRMARPKSAPLRRDPQPQGHSTKLQDPASYHVAHVKPLAAEYPGSAMRVEETTDFLKKNPPSEVVREATGRNPFRQNVVKRPKSAGARRPSMQTFSSTYDKFQRIYLPVSTCAPNVAEGMEATTRSTARTMVRVAKPGLEEGTSRAADLMVQAEAETRAMLGSRAPAPTDFMPDYKLETKFVKGLRKPIQTVNRGKLLGVLSQTKSGTLGSTTSDRHRMKKYFDDMNSYILRSDLDSSAQLVDTSLFSSHFHLSDKDGESQHASEPVDQGVSGWNEDGASDQGSPVNGPHMFDDDLRGEPQVAAVSDYYTRKYDPDHDVYANPTLLGPVSMEEKTLDYQESHGIGDFTGHLIHDSEAKPRALVTFSDGTEVRSEVADKGARSTMVRPKSANLQGRMADSPKRRKRPQSAGARASDRALAGSSTAGQRPMSASSSRGDGRNCAHVAGAIKNPNRSVLNMKSGVIAFGSVYAAEPSARQHAMTSRSTFSPTRLVDRRDRSVSPPAQKAPARRPSSAGRKRPTSAKTMKKHVEPRQKWTSFQEDNSTKRASRIPHDATVRGSMKFVDNSRPDTEIYSAYSEPVVQSHLTNRNGGFDPKPQHQQNSHGYTNLSKQEEKLLRKPIYVKHDEDSFDIDTGGAVAPPHTQSHPIQHIGMKGTQPRYGNSDTRRRAESLVANVSVSGSSVEGLAGRKHVTEGEARRSAQQVLRTA